MTRMGGRASGDYPMLAVADALRIVLAETAPLPQVTAGLDQALGAILAQDIMAMQPLPPFPASVVDGYAVQAGGGPGEFDLVGSVTAGRMPDFTVGPGQAAYITTGAPLPPGADAVVLVEESTRLGHARVRLAARVRPGENVRPVGFDVAAGQVVLPAGTRLGPAEIGLLATVGMAQAPVIARPRVAVLSTGDELVEPGTPPGPGQIRDSNRAMLRSAVAAAGGIVVDLGIATDDAADLETRLLRGLAEADVLLSTGGVSMGDLDLIKPLLERLGTVHFGRVRLKPGKPCTFATVEREGRRRLVFGLPGNPVSGLVTFHLLVVPALRKLAGWAEPNLRRVQAHLAQTLALDPVRPEYHRATVHWDATLNQGRGGYVAVSTGAQASSRLLSMRSANVLLELPQAEGTLPAGSVVSALVIGEL